MRTLARLSPIAPRYDALLVDLWGVVHDGTQLYPGVAEALAQLKAHGKKIIFISNAPRRNHKAVAVLEKLGVTQAMYDEVITSGELGYRWLQAGKAPWGKRYYYLGQSKDADIIHDLDFMRVDDLKNADFILNIGYGAGVETAGDVTPLFRAARALALPMLCLNPDLEVVKITGERNECAGALALRYESLGGSVTWFGKPYPEIYDYCLAQLYPIVKARILAVGDNLDTDIPGARDAGLDAVLVTGGILHNCPMAEIENLGRRKKLAPNYAMPRFIW